MVEKPGSIRNFLKIFSFLLWFLAKASANNPGKFVDVRPCETVRWDGLKEENRLQIEDEKLRKHGDSTTPLIFRLANSNGTFKCPGGREETTLRYDSQSFRFTPFGHLGVEKWNEKAQTEVLEWYNPEEYCVKTLTSKKQIDQIKYCKDEETNQSIVRVIKCCTPGYTVTPVNGTKHNCLEEEIRSWKPTIYDSSSIHGICVFKKTGTTFRIQTRINADTSYGRKWHFRESYRFKGINVKRVRWRLLETGKLVELIPPVHGSSLAGKWVERKNLYCLDGLQKYHRDGSRTSEIAVSLEVEAFEDECGSSYPSDEANSTSTEEDENCTSDGSGTYSNCENITQNDPCTHMDAGLEKKSGAENTLYIVSFFLAVIPLVMTIVAYWLTWSTQNLHGWTVFSHILSLILMNISIGTALVLTNSVNPEEGSRNLKVIVGVLCHFFFLSTFLWLTMINFDLWWTFRKLKSLVKHKSLMRFVAYSLVSWGVPLIFVLVGLILDAHYGEDGYDSDCDIRVPNYGQSKFFLEPAAEGIYIYYPLLVLLILNCGFFITTVTKIYSPQCKRTGVISKKSSLDKYSVELFLKLFVVMGLTFTFEFISWVVHPNSNTEETISDFFVVVDIFNILGRAILIFIIFACKPQVIAKIRRLHKGAARQSISGKCSTQDTVDATRIRMSSLND